MSRTEKLREKFLAQPPPRDFTWKELIKLMSGFGYQLRPGKGSHKAFYCENTQHYIRGIPEPHPGNEVLVCYIKSIKQALSDEGVI